MHILVGDPPLKTDLCPYLFNHLLHVIMKIFGSPTMQWLNHSALGFIVKDDILYEDFF